MRLIRLSSFSWQKIVIFFMLFPLNNEWKSKATGKICYIENISCQWQFNQLISIYESWPFLRPFGRYSLRGFMRFLFILVYRIFRVLSTESFQIKIFNGRHKIVEILTETSRSKMLRGIIFCIKCWSPSNYIL
jgi:hypothetical protein